MITLTDKTIDFLKQAAGQMDWTVDRLAGDTDLPHIEHGSPPGLPIATSLGPTPPISPRHGSSNQPAASAELDALARHRLDMVLSLIRGTERLEELAGRYHVSADALLQWRDEFLAAGQARLAAIEPMMNGVGSRSQATKHLCPSCAGKTDKHE